MPFPESMLLRDRAEAGRALGERLAARSDPPTGGGGSVVLALPRGGVPVGFEIARRLDLPLGLFFAHKIRAPRDPEAAVGAVAEGGSVFYDAEAIRLSRAGEDYVAAEVAHQLAAIERRRRLYGEAAPAPRIDGKRAILVDDGVATGATFIAAARGLRAAGARSITAAVPVVLGGALESLEAHADEVETLLRPDWAYAIGQCYLDFRPVTDQDVLALLTAARRRA